MGWGPSRTWAPCLARLKACEAENNSGVVVIFTDLTAPFMDMASMVLGLSAASPQGRPSISCQHFSHHCTEHSITTLLLSQRQLAQWYKRGKGALCCVVRVCCWTGCKGDRYGCCLWWTGEKDCCRLRDKTGVGERHNPKRVSHRWVSLHVLWDSAHASLQNSSATCVSGTFVLTEDTCSKLMSICPLLNFFFMSIYVSAVFKHRGKLWFRAVLKKHLSNLSSNTHRMFALRPSSAMSALLLRCIHSWWDSLSLKWHRSTEVL